RAAAARAVGAAACAVPGGRAEGRSRRGMSVDGIAALVLYGVRSTCPSVSGATWLAAVARCCDDAGGTSKVEPPRAQWRGGRRSRRRRRPASLLRFELVGRRTEVERDPVPAAAIGLVHEDREQPHRHRAAFHG